MEIESKPLAPNASLGHSESPPERPSDARPDKFPGLNSTWRALTKEERLLHIFDTRTREQNISVHLYNAIALKSRQANADEASNPSSSSNKACLQKKRNPKEGTQDEFVPQKSWTAWPLSPDVVPRNGEQTDDESGAERWTWSRRGVGQHSLELEDILIAMTLRLAKEKFQARDLVDQIAHNWPSNSAMTIDSCNESDDDGGNHAFEAGRAYKKEITEHDFLNEARVGAIHSSNPASEPENVPELHLKSHNQLITLRPQVMIDDENSGALLRSTIRHHLSQLDQLLMALHEGRKACLHQGSGGRQSEMVSFSGEGKLDVGPSSLDGLSNIDVILHEQTAEQQAGRPGIADMPTTSTLKTYENVGDCSQSNSGRKRKLNEPWEGEMPSEMLLGIARSQKQPVRSRISAAAGSKTTSPLATSHKRPGKRGNLQHAQKIRSTRLSLRGWSELLGAAALVGFSPRTIAHTTQTCATLFGEGMAILSLADNPPLGKDDHQTTHYLPRYIPGGDATVHFRPGTEQCQIEQPLGLGGVSRCRSKAKSEDLEASEEFNKQEPEFDGLRCPWRGCTRHKESFASKKYLTRHLQNAHKLYGIKLEKALKDGKDEILGGVHTDGFLNKIARRQGWRGTDGEPRQRCKVELKNM